MNRSRYPQQAEPKHHITLAVGAAGVVALFAASGASAGTIGFSKSVYPPPIPPTGSTMGIEFPPSGQFMCPNPEGIRPVRAIRRGDVLRALNRLDRADTEEAKRFADRAGWPWLTWLGSHTGPGFKRLVLRGNLVVIERAQRKGDLYTSFYERACGRTVTAGSVVALYCGKATKRGSTYEHYAVNKCNPADVVYKYFLSRDGRWLFWGLQGGG